MNWHRLLAGIFPCLLPLAMPGASPQATGQAGTATAPTTDVGLESPIRISRLRQGPLLVADYNQERIHVFGKRRRGFHQSFAVRGRPLALAASSSHLYVGNDTAKTVDVYTTRGALRGQLGGRNGRFEKPTDIALDEGRHLVFVVDGLAGVVRTFDVTTIENGVPAGTVPAGGADPTKLTKPTGIALDPTRSEVLISDFGDSALGIEPCVRVFGYDGTLIDVISSDDGSGVHRFVRPQGLVVDGDHILLVESLLGQVLILDRNTGALLKRVGSYGTGPGELSLPLDIEIDPWTKDLFVTCYQTHRLEVFMRGGQL